MANKTAIQNFKISEQLKKDFNNLCLLTNSKASQKLQNFVAGETAVLMKQPITREFLTLYGWKIDDELYWHKEKYVYNYFCGHLGYTDNSKTFWEVNTIEELLSITRNPDL